MKRLRLRKEARTWCSWEGPGPHGRKVFGGIGYLLCGHVAGEDRPVAHAHPASQTTGIGARPEPWFRKVQTPLRMSPWKNAIQINCMVSLFSNFRLRTLRVQRENLSPQKPTGSAQSHRAEEQQGHDQTPEHPKQATKDEASQGLK